MRATPILQKIQPPSNWNDLPWGEYYLSALERELAPWWPKVFGYHLLKIGTLSIQIDTRPCLIPHQVNLAMLGNNVDVITDPCHLPIRSNSVDACLLAHTLNYARHPYQILCEADRVLVDDGWLILTGFNPISILGIGKLVPILRHRQPYLSHMFSAVRCQDWLQMLNYEIVHHDYIQLLPWRSHDLPLTKRYFSMLCCLNIVIARKRIVPLTPMMQRRKLQPKWRQIVGGMAKNFYQ